MAAILTAAEMRALEQEAIASGEVTGLELMERAGRGVVDAILEEWPETAEGSHHAVVLCGPGNNGGDGFVVARLLRQRDWMVWVILYGDPDQLPPDAKSNYERWARREPVKRVGALNEVSTHVGGWLMGKLGQVKTLICVDALFGLGLKRPIQDFDLIGRDAWNDTFSIAGVDPINVAIDVPSGLCADSGRILLDPPPQYAGYLPLRGDLTVTFHLPKAGHYLASGPQTIGKLKVVDIGLNVAFPGKSLRPLYRAPLRLLTGKGPNSAFRVRKGQLHHKYSHGHALLLSGGPGRGGAARLAARGALRIGAGLVTLAVPPAALQENAARLDAIMLRSVRDAEALTDPLSDPRLNALAAGPGLGTSDREAALLHALLDASRGAGEDAAPPAPARSAAGPQETGRVADAEVRATADPADRPSDGGSRDAPGEGGAEVSPTTNPSSAAVHRPVPATGTPENAVEPSRPETAFRGAEPSSRPAPGRDATPKLRPVVLDADALTLLARHPELRAKLHPACVLTPHEGEFARLFPAIAERLRAPPTTGPAYSKVDAARDAAREAGCVILLKGPDTVIAEPPRPGSTGQQPSPGRAAINAAVYDRAAPWLATAGSGDVLAGMITGLLARGFGPFDGACTAAWLHVEAARSFGPGLIAEDLPEELPKVFRALGL